MAYNFMKPEATESVPKESFVTRVGEPGLRRRLLQIAGAAAFTGNSKQKGLSLRFRPVGRSNGAQGFRESNCACRLPAPKTGPIGLIVPYNGQVPQLRFCAQRASRRSACWREHVGQF